MAQITLTPIIEGTLARASEVMGNFQALANEINGNLDGSNIQDGSITAPKIVDGAVLGSKLASGSVDSAQLVDEAVTTLKLGPLSVTGPKIANGSISTDKIGGLQVTAPKLGNLAVSTDKIDDRAVTEGKIADGAVGTAKIGNNAVSPRHVNFIHEIREIAYLYVGADGTILQGGGLPSGASFSRLSTGTYRITGLGSMVQANKFLAIGSTNSPSNRFMGAGASLDGTLTVTTVNSSGNPVDAEFGMILIRGVP